MSRPSSSTCPSLSTIMPVYWIAMSSIPGTEWLTWRQPLSVSLRQASKSSVILPTLSGVTTSVIALPNQRSTPSRLSSERTMDTSVIRCSVSSNRAMSAVLSMSFKRPDGLSAGRSMLAIVIVVR